MAEQQSQQHRLHEVLAVAVDHHRSRHHGHLSRRFRRSLLPEHLPHVVLPLGHVLHHRCSDRLRDLRLRRHGQRLRPDSTEPELFGLLSDGLFRLAEGACIG